MGDAVTEVGVLLGDAVVEVTGEPVGVCVGAPVGNDGTIGLDVGDGDTADIPYTSTLSYI